MPSFVQKVKAISKTGLFNFAHNAETRPTTQDTIECSFRWEIKDFARLLDDAFPWKYGLESEHFSPSNNETLAFSVGLGAKESEKDGKKYLQVYLLPWEMPIQIKITLEMVVTIEGKEKYPKGR